MVDPKIQEILSNHPFLSYLTYGGNDYIGIIQNFDEFVTTIYDYASLKSLDQKSKFLELADQWWWESNRMIPINVFLKHDWIEFKFSLKTFNSKDVKLLHGPYVSLREIAGKRSKRRSITLIRKI